MRRLIEKHWIRHNFSQVLYNVWLWRMHTSNIQRTMNTKYDPGVTNTYFTAEFHVKWNVNDERNGRKLMKERIKRMKERVAMSLQHTDINNKRRNRHLACVHNHSSLTTVRTHFRTLLILRTHNHLLLELRRKLLVWKRKEHKFAPQIDTNQN